MERELEELIWQRARSACEYCAYPAEFAQAPFQIDHIIAQKHQGATTADNLALSCYSCNSLKGPNIAGLDPDSGRIVRLYHPRKDRWTEHFSWQGPVLQGHTAIGRATLAVLGINRPIQVEKRRWLMAEELYFPA